MIAIITLIGTGTLFLLAGGAFAVLGFLCRSRVAKYLFWTISAFSLIAVAGLATSDLLLPSSCSGSFLKGIGCPLEVSNSVPYWIAQFSFIVGLWAYGLTWYLGWLVALFAFAVELYVRFARKI